MSIWPAAFGAINAVLLAGNATAWLRFRQQSRQAQQPIEQRMFPMTTDAASNEKATDPAAELRALKHADQVRARSEWRSRRAAAISAVALPAAPYRIRHMAEQNIWTVEKATPMARDYPIIPDGAGYHGVVQFGWNDPIYPAEAYRADIDIPATVGWVRIGPQRPAAAGYRSTEQPSLSYEIAPFFTFDEAAAWLRAYLKPVAKEVYFSVAGEETKAPA
jgi:hypothetical protein